MEIGDIIKNYPNVDEKEAIDKIVDTMRELQDEYNKRTKNRFYEIMYLQRFIIGYKNRGNLFLKDTEQGLVLELEGGFCGQPPGTYLVKKLLFEGISLNNYVDIITKEAERIAKNMKKFGTSSK